MNPIGLPVAVRDRRGFEAGNNRAGDIAAAACSFDAGLNSATQEIFMDVYAAPRERSNDASSKIFWLFYKPYGCSQGQALFLCQKTRNGLKGQNHMEGFRRVDLAP